MDKYKRGDILENNELGRIFVITSSHPDDSYGCLYVKSCCPNVVIYERYIDLFFSKIGEVNLEFFDLFY